MARGSRFKDPGCLRCKQRKIKCDMQRPHCTTCAARKEKCPGYPSKIEFRDAKTKLEIRLGLDPDWASKQLVTTGSVCNSSGDISSPSSSSSALPKTTAPLERAVVAKPLEIRYDSLMQKGSTGEQPKMTQRPAPCSSAQLQHWMIRLMDQNIPANTRLNIYGLSVLEHIPKHLGFNPALDAATKFLCHVHEATIGVHNRITDTLRLQTMAISKLRNCIADPKLCKTPETVTAAILVASVEANMPDHSVPAVIKHASGIRALIANQDPPSKDSNELRKAVVMSAQGAMWTHAVMEGEASIFDSAPYVAIVREPPPTNHDFTAREDIARSLFYTIIPFPRLLRDMRRLCLLAQDDANYASDSLDIVYRCHTTRYRVLTPHKDLTYFQVELQKCLNDPNFVPDSELYVYPEFSAYASVQATIMMITRRMLAKIQPETSHLIDHNSKLDGVTEIVRLEHYLRNAHAVFAQSQPRALLYITCTLQTCVDVMHSIDGQGNFFDVLNPSRQDPLPLFPAGTITVPPI